MTPLDSRQRCIDLLGQGKNDEVLQHLGGSLADGGLGGALAHFFCGVALQQSGRLHEAIDAYHLSAEQTLADLLMCWNNQAGACYNVEDYQRAIEVVEPLRDYKVFDIDLMALHVLSLIGVGRKVEAEKTAREFVANLPRNAEATRWLIHATWRNRKYLEPILLSSEIPVERWDRCGLAHELLQSLTELELFDVVDSLFPAVYGENCNVLDREETWATAGLLALSRGDLHGAKSIYEAGLARGYKDKSAILNLSLIELLQGDYENGWKHYLIRGDNPFYLRVVLPESVPRWKGEDLSGKTIVVSSEQGIGDMIQFVRFVPGLERRGARVVFASYPEVVKLLSNDPRASKKDVSPLAAEDIDFYTLLLDLPHLLGVKSPADIPNSIPYLYANCDKERDWNDTLGSLPGLKVGLVWAGNPEFTGDHYRSASINIFSPLAALVGVHFFGLQKGVGAKEAKCPPEDLAYTWIGDRFASFEDTAAAIVNLDLVISTDTSVVHLAAALGKPVWLLLSKRSLDYRWADFGSGNVWYPNVRVFRQSIDDDWVGLVRDCIRPALACEVLSHNTAHLPSWAIRALRIDAGLVDWQEIDWRTWSQEVQSVQGIEDAARWLSRNLHDRDVTDGLDSLTTAISADSAAVVGHALRVVRGRNLLKACLQEEAEELLSSVAEEFGDTAVGRAGFLDWGWGYYRRGAWKLARAVWERGVIAFPKDGHLHYLLGTSVREAGDRLASLAHFRKTLECSPRHYLAHLAIAGILSQDRPVEAWAAAQRAVQFKRNDVSAWQSIARLCHDRGMYWLGEQILLSKGQIASNFSSRILHVRQLAMSGRIAESRELLANIALEPNADLQSQIDYAQGLYYAELRNEAVSVLLRAIERYPDSRELRFTLGFTQLRLGNYQAGWENYWKGMRRDTPRFFLEWQGESLAGKSVIVIQDQGQGDAIQFFPLLLDVWALSPKRLTVAVSRPLVTLFRSQAVPFDVIDLEKLDWEDYRYDYQVDQMALPYLLGVDLLNPSRPQPTLIPQARVMAAWRERLSRNENLKVGIVWSGGDLFKANYVRSTALSDWRVLWELSGVQFYSLQKDVHSNQAAVLGLPLENIATDCPTWLETLAVINSLDLIITTCTAAAHVAGSINKPTWVILSNEYVDYRWLEDREDSPWYPSVRLIRRQKGESWQQVLFRVGEKLVSTYDHVAWKNWHQSTE